jgi:hypothetical protein
MESVGECPELENEEIPTRPQVNAHAVESQRTRWLAGRERERERGRRPTTSAAAPDPLQPDADRDGRSSAAAVATQSQLAVMHKLGCHLPVCLWHGHSSRASLRGDRGDSPLHHRPAHPCIIAVFTPASALPARASPAHDAVPGLPSVTRILQSRVTRILQSRVTRILQSTRVRS